MAAPRIPPIGWSSISLGTDYYGLLEAEKGETMRKPTLASLTFLIASLLALSVLYVQRSRASGPPFSNGTLSGAYVFSVYGSLAADATGIANFDGAGNVTGSFFQNLDGATPSQCSGSFSGTYSVDATGRLSMTLTFTPGDNCTGTSTRNFVGGTVHNGHAFVFAQSDFGQTSAGTGIEQ